MARVGRMVLLSSARGLSNAVLVSMLLNGFDEPVREFEFMGPLGRWRFDFAWPAMSVAVEIEGGHWIRGKGSHGSGRYEEDCRKYNKAVANGWTVLRFTYGMLRGEMAGCRALLAIVLGEDR